MNWSKRNAGIGYSAGDDFFMNHILSRQGNVNDIACLNQPNSPWSNVVYKVNEAAEYPKEQQTTEQPKEQIKEGKQANHYYYYVHAFGATICFRLQIRFVQWPVIHILMRYSMKCAVILRN